MIYHGDMFASGVAPVILGFLACGPRSGYDIKTTVDRSTRFFWAASYGSIYPELSRLEREGLIAGEAASSGGRRRKSYRITDAGRDALAAWLRSEGAGWELRDEGLLKIFFADSVAPGEALERVRALRADRERTRERLYAVRDDPARPRGGSSELALDYGIAIYERTIEWCRETEARLARRRRAAPDEGRSAA